MTWSCAMMDDMCRADQNGRLTPVYLCHHFYIWLLLGSGHSGGIRSRAIRTRQPENGPTVVLILLIINSTATALVLHQTNRDT